MGEYEERMARHKVTFTKQTRQLGRARVTDHFWWCSCGARCTAPTGFSHEHEARVNSFAHRQWWNA